MALKDKSDDELREDIESFNATILQYRTELHRRRTKTSNLPTGREAIIRIGNGAVFRRSTWQADRWDVFGGPETYSTEHLEALVRQHGFTVIWPHRG